MQTPATIVITYRIELPFPVSANRLWRIADSRRRKVLGWTIPRMHLSPEYVSWIKEADGLYLSQKREIGPLRTLGLYALQCVFSRAKRSPIADGDNLCKCVHDYLERIAIIKNDCLCEGGSWVWGDAPSGCRVTVEGYLWEDDHPLL